ncbi:MAG: T9SS type A sorting domain-containing protein [Bacteroidales bacterium]|nr:T9SS type A sorting domain-containing protein [Bacteroidales bacterium]
MKTSFYIFLLSFGITSSLIGQNSNPSDSQDWMRNSATSNNLIASNTIKIENEKDGDISIYPVPAIKELYIDCSDNVIVRVNLMDITGKVVLSHKVTVSDNSKIKIDIKDLSAGIYFLQMELTDKQITRRIQILQKQ